MAASIIGLAGVYCCFKKDGPFNELYFYLLLIFGIWRQQCLVRILLAPPKIGKIDQRSFHIVCELSYISNVYIICLETNSKTSRFIYALGTFSFINTYLFVILKMN